MLIDTHAHLDDKRYDEDREEMLSRARAGLINIINVGYDLDSSKRSISLAEAHDFIFAAVGVHPHDAAKVPANYLEQLQAMAQHKKVVAIGEIGLDYYYDLSPRQVQRDVFASQINLAKQMKLPIIIHDRDAHGDIMDVLREYGGQDLRGVLHCFSGSVEMAQECVALGFYISFAGPLTFKNGKKLLEVVKAVPRDRILVETDSPYLTPEPNRGKRNESAYVYYVAEKIAELLSISLEEVATITSANARTLFKLA